MGHSRKGTFSLPSWEPEPGPSRVQTAVVMSEDSDPWGIDHNKKRRRQVWLSYLLSMDLIPAVKKEKGMCHPRMEMPSLHEVIASTQQLE